MHGDARRCTEVPLARPRPPARPPARARAHAHIGTHRKRSQTGKRSCVPRVGREGPRGQPRGRGWAFHAAGPCGCESELEAALNILSRATRSARTRVGARTHARTHAHAHTYARRKRSQTGKRSCVPRVGREGPRGQPRGRGWAFHAAGPCGCESELEATLTALPQKRQKPQIPRDLGPVRAGGVQSSPSARRARHSVFKCLWFRSQARVASAATRTESFVRPEYLSSLYPSAARSYS